MSNAIQGVNVNKSASGLCPHGTIPGACPICSGMGGGSSRMGERPQKAGEWSYHHCAMVGNLMKAHDERVAVHEKNLQNHIEAVKFFEQNLAQISQRLTALAIKLSNSFISKPVAIIINNIVVPIINNIKNVVNFVVHLGEKFAQIKEKFIDIQDKLNAIFGEAKAFIDKKVSELVGNIKSKIDSILKIFKSNNTKDDETKIDEDKKIFRLKNFIQKILGKSKEDKDKKEQK